MMMDVYIIFFIYLHYIFLVSRTLILDSIVILYLIILEYRNFSKGDNNYLFYLEKIIIKFINSSR